ncbi:hypothetical protein SDC9_205642 [bioreactor metagenome]|uniref:Uncharacterized protein n=1 Tax=bioreactor metagenome TaxID=1076179 RepID=A0A645J3D1_9ZZZZ
MKHFTGMLYPTKFIEHDGRSHIVAYQHQVEQAVVHLIHIGTFGINIVDLSPVGIQVIEQTQQNFFWFFPMKKSAVNKVDAQRTECILLQQGVLFE